MATLAKRKPLHEQLLEQAEYLAKKDKNPNPPQASFRRAISTAYYAVFHLLIHAAASNFARGPDRKKLRLLLSRTFDHGEMKTVCGWFDSGGSFPTVIVDIFGILASHSRPHKSPKKEIVIPADLATVAMAFRALQTKRHQADYHLHWRITRNEVMDEVNRAKDAFSSWERIRKDPKARLFLTCLLAGKRLQDR